MADQDQRKFLDRLLKRDDIIPSLELGNANSVISPTGYSEKGKKTAMCTESNELHHQIMRLTRLRSLLMAINGQAYATENIAIPTSRNAPTEGADYIPPQQC